MRERITACSVVAGHPGVLFTVEQDTPAGRGLLARLASDLLGLHGLKFAGPRSRGSHRAATSGGYVVTSIGFHAGEVFVRASALHDDVSADLAPFVRQAVDLAPGERISLDLEVRADGSRAAEAAHVA